MPTGTAPSVQHWLRKEERDGPPPLPHPPTRMREGVATELQVQALRTTMLIALEIERLGYVRGLHGHIEAALIAIKSALTRGVETGEWRPTQLQLYELDAITNMVDLHEHQLRNLAAIELQTATKRVIAHMQSQGGGELLNVAPAELGMEVTPRSQHSASASRGPGSSSTASRTSRTATGPPTSETVCSCTTAKPWPPATTTRPARSCRAWACCPPACPPTKTCPVAASSAGPTSSTAASSTHRPGSKTAPTALCCATAAPSPSCH